MSTSIWTGTIVGETKLRNAPLCARRALVATLACAAMLLAAGCTRIGASDEGDMSAMTISPANSAKASPSLAVTSTQTAETQASPLPLFTSEPLPDYLWTVFPEPGRTVSVTQYLEESQPLLFPTGSIKPQVCISVRFQPLMDRGDSFENVSEWLPRLQLTINGDRQGRPVIAQTRDLGCESPRDPETGELLDQVPDCLGALLCYDNEFATEPHVVQAEISRTSGTVERYRWWFIVTED